MAAFARQYSDYYYDLVRTVVSLLERVSPQQTAISSVFLVRLWFLQVSFARYWLENSSYILYFVLITCTDWLTNWLTAAHQTLQTQLKCFFVEISRNLQHLPSQLSWRADLIRKPFVAITITNLQETWRSAIRFDLILNLIVDIKTNLVWIWYEVQ